MSTPDPYWPPTLAMLKVDAKIHDTRDDAKLSMELESAVDYVEGVRRDVDFTGLLTEEELETAGMVRVGWALHLGTLRLAQRWHARGRSPDGMIASPDSGSVRVSTGDADIDRLLKVGRFARPVIA